MMNRTKFNIYNDLTDIKIFSGRNVRIIIELLLKDTIAYTHCRERRQIRYLFVCVNNCVRILLLFNTISINITTLNNNNL